MKTLVLGTAQLGMRYGIANRIGQPDFVRTAEILDGAYAFGIRTLDTAAAYGDSELMLGRAGVAKWDIITKVPSLFGLSDDKIEHAITDTILRSLERMKVDYLFAVLAHDYRDLMGERGRRFTCAMKRLQSEKLIQFFGVSVYSQDDLKELSPLEIQIVQSPFNILDQRILKSNIAAEIHARSIFLQGLLLLPPEARPTQFAHWNNLLSRYDERIRDSGLDPVAFCLGFALRHQAITKCVVGIEHPGQLDGIVDAVRVSSKIVIEADDLVTSDLDLIDPRRWENQL